MANFFENLFNMFNKKPNAQEINEENMQNLNDQDIESMIDVSWAGYYTK